MFNPVVGSTVLVWVAPLQKWCAAIVTSVFADSKSLGFPRERILNNPHEDGAAVLQHLDTMIGHTPFVNAIVFHDIADVTNMENNVNQPLGVVPLAMRAPDGDQLHPTWNPSGEYWKPRDVEISLEFNCLEIN